MTNIAYSDKAALLMDVPGALSVLRLPATGAAELHPWKFAVVAFATCAVAIIVACAWHRQDAVSDSRGLCSSVCRRDGSCMALSRAWQSPKRFLQMLPRAPAVQGCLQGALQALKSASNIQAEATELQQPVGASAEPRGPAAAADSQACELMWRMAVGAEPWVPVASYAQACELTRQKAADAEPWVPAASGEEVKACELTRPTAAAALPWLPAALGEEVCVRSSKPHTAAASSEQARSCQDAWPGDVVPAVAFPLSSVPRERAAAARASAASMATSIVRVGVAAAARAACHDGAGTPTLTCRRATAAVRAAAAVAAAEARCPPALAA
eukprot:CAMPEP_0177328214 /NCGR_PEP_ID=MMETSP0368-20130122/19307_1 /TAXON_ID=447022 ORGANISM="Scrippsiella hangoei-like, Strain SHHI-4" /NCGR_SAMPLE_ID=MMETSP0368 /ASSEMBLY_ACC=CAM_ASM_000363 /LENGTH=326 /DNA_ID=CAMNT_0018788333 /DNA_START=74 /DNA_END=1054 /DNA_ORIENTATION=+